ncbi:MAG: glycosyltransferase family 9 protein [Pseudomonadota bacterium]|nr:glycosyltransferase family 9 protein [Pseudomonadota bacterium]
MLDIRAPDHLGDGVMALPAIRALAALGQARVYAPRWGAELYEGLDVRPMSARPDGDTGVVLKPSFGAAWRWRHLPRRVGLATAGRGLLLTDAVPVRAEHRRDGYARVAAVLGARAEGPPRYTARGEAPPLPETYIGLNPYSPSPTVRWPHFRALADRLRGPVVFFAGPGEGAAVRAIAGPHPVVEGLSLPDFAAALEQCRVFVSNDSGAAHFAAACGTRVVVMHGSTTAARTGASFTAGGEAIEGPDLWCRPCYAKRCFVGLGCLRSIETSRVVAAIEHAA